MFSNENVPPKFSTWIIIKSLILGSSRQFSCAGEKEVDPRLAELASKVVGRVEEVCNHLNACDFINTTKGNFVT